MSIEAQGIERTLRRQIHRLANTDETHALHLLHCKGVDRACNVRAAAKASSSEASSPMAEVRWCGECNEVMDTFCLCTSTITVEFFHKRFHEIFW